MKSFMEKIKNLELPSLDQCPHCKTRMNEDWQDEIDEVGELTGYAFEILSCGNCGYTELI